MAFFPKIHRPDSSLGRFLLLLCQCFVLVGLAIVFMAAIRELYFWLIVVREVPAEMIQSDDVWRMRYLGLRFDARSGAILAIIPLLACLFLFYFKATWRLLIKFLTIWSVFASSLSFCSRSVTSTTSRHFKPLSTSSFSTSCTKSLRPS